MTSYELAMRRERRAKRREERRVVADSNAAQELMAILAVMLGYWLLFYVTGAVLQVMYA